MSGRNICLLLALCLPVAAGPAAAVTGRGTVFWGAWPRTHASLETSAELVVMADQPTDVEVDGAFTASGTAQPGNPWIVGVPSLLRTAVDRVPVDVGFRIRSVDGTSPIGVLFRVPRQAEASDDIARLLPVSELGTRYVVTAYEASISVAPSLYAVVATEDATTVTTSTACGGDGGPVALDAGQVYQVFCGSDDAPPDVTGSVVTSDRPVAVLAGASTAWIPTDRLSGDFVLEAMAPVASWGTECYTAPLPKGSNALDGIDIVRVTASGPVDVTVDDGVAPQVLNLPAEGDYLEIRTARALHLTATAPVDVQLFATGVESSDLGDPFMATVPAVGAWSRWTRVYLPPDYTLGSHLTLLAPDSALASIRVAGQPVASWSSLPGGTHSWARVDLGLFAGERLISSAEPIGVLAYGFNDAYQPDPDLGLVPGSYGYPAVDAVPMCRMDAVAAGPTESCAGETVRLDGGGTSVVGCANVQYRWLFEGQPLPGCGYSPEPICETTFQGEAEYVLEVRCADDPTECAPGVAVLRVVEGEPDVIDLQPDPAEVCEGTSLLLRAPSGYISYEWSSVPPDPGVTPRVTVRPELSVTPEVDTVYSVVARESSGCGGVDDLEVTVIPDPLPPFLGNVLLVAREGPGDLRLSWTDLSADPVAGYEPVALVCDVSAACAPPPDPATMDALPGAAAATLPGVETTTMTPPAGRLVFLQMRALSPCASAPGPTCDGFAAQVACP